MRDLKASSKVLWRFSVPLEASVEGTDLTRFVVKKSRPL